MFTFQILALLSNGKDMLCAMVKSLQTISENKPKLFSTLCEDPSHQTLALKKLIVTFLKVKMGHLCRNKNENMNSLIRHIHKKMPIFKHE